MRPLPDSAAAHAHFGFLVIAKPVGTLSLPNNTWSAFFYKASSYSCLVGSLYEYGVGRGLVQDSSSLCAQVLAFKILRVLLEHETPAISRSMRIPGCAYPYYAHTGYLTVDNSSRIC